MGKSCVIFRNAVDIQIREEKWPLAAPFRITDRTFTELDIVVVMLRDGDLEGHGEAAGVYYHGETAFSMTTQMEAVREPIEAGVDREVLRRLLPAGGARNALDCALWDLEAKRAGQPVWQLAGLAAPRALLTTYTLGADEPAKMARGALAYAGARALKVKLTGEASDAERVRAVRAARPDVWIGVDANQGFTRESLERMLPVLVAARVGLIEQPLPIEQDAELEGLNSPIPIAADESVQGLSDVAALVGRFNVVNIKLDKCGGLTEALAMAEEARRLGLKIMVGNMLGTSLAMAPAFLVGQLCAVADLDGPLLLASDRSPGVTYEKGLIWCPQEVWGAPSTSGPAVASSGAQA